MTRYFASRVDDAFRISVVESDADDGFDSFLRADELDASDLPGDFASWRVYETYSHGNNSVRVLSQTGE